MSQTPLKQYVTVIVVTLVLILGASAIQAAWAPPTLPPPDGNVDAPINVGDLSQRKLGQLLINTNTAQSGPGPFATGLIVFGKVGIGTTNPLATLQVNGNAIFGTNTASPGQVASPVNVSFGGTYGNSTPGSKANLKWDMYNGGINSYRYGIGMSTGLMEFQAGTSGGFGFYPNGGTVSAMAINSNGNVGIGIAVPTAKLEVAGQVKITGGSPGAGKVLTSDANGLATWQTPGSSSEPVGTVKGYGEGTYSYAAGYPLTGGPLTSCTAIAAPFSCSGVDPSCPTGWEIIRASKSFGTCEGTECGVFYMCAKTI